MDEFHFILHPCFHTFPHAPAVLFLWRCPNLNRAALFFNTKEEEAALTTLAGAAPFQPSASRAR
jgi:hypothetical protein